MNFIRFILSKSNFKNNKAFIWVSSKNSFLAIKNIQSLELKLLIGIDSQKNHFLKIQKILLKETLQTMLYCGEQEGMEKVRL